MQFTGLEFLLIGIFFGILGVLQTFFPGLIFHIKEGWKRDGSWAEPSNAYLLSTRLGGIGSLITAVLCIFVFFTS